MSLREALIPEALPGLITALQAKLKPARDAMALESRINNPYGNVIAVREAGR
jgi:ABC-type metal ion transport system substrate-binding protein